MKILKVSFLNLNSLQGNHSIDFTASPLVESGLFAITGETGAGKTTILDAITLALYDKVPRTSDPKLLMSYNTGECFSEVTFEVNQKVYRAKWAVARARRKAEGKLQGTKRELVELKNAWDNEGKIIAEKVKEVNQKIKDLTHLDYNRFVKSVMLAQGDFAAFLQAKKNDRGELLERITGTEEYSNISIAAFKKAGEEKQKLDKLQTELGAHQLLSQEEIERLNEAKKQQQTATQQLQGQLEKQTQAFNWLEGIGKLKEEKQTIENRLETFQNTKADFTPQLQKLTLHRKASPFQNAISLIEKDQKRLVQMQESFHVIQKNIPTLTQKISESAAQKEVSQQALEQAKLERTEKQKLFYEVVELDKEIDQQVEYLQSEKKKWVILRDECDAKDNELNKQSDGFAVQQQKLEMLSVWLVENEKEKEIEGVLPLLEAKQDEVEKKQKRIASLEKEYQTTTKEVAQLNKNQQELVGSVKTIQAENERFEEEISTLETKIKALLGDENVETLEEKIEALNQQLEVEKELVQLATKYQEEHEVLANSQEKAKELEEKQRQQNQYLNQKQTEVKLLEDHLADLTARYEAELLIQKYEADRGKLVEGEPCPLCGSTSHPLGLESDPDETLLKKSAKEKALKKGQKEAQTFAEQLKVTETQLENEAENRVTLKAKLEKLQSSFASKISTNYSITDREILEKEVQQKQLLLKENKGKYTQVRGANKKIGEQKEALQNGVVALNQKQNELTKIETLSASKAEVIQSLKKDVEAAETELQNEKNLLSEKLSQFDLTPQNKFLPLLKKRLKTLQDKTLQKEELQGKIQELDKEMEGLRKMLDQQKKRRNEWGTELKDKHKAKEVLVEKRKDLFGEKVVKEEDEKLDAKITLNEKNAKSAENFWVEQQNHLKQQHNKSEELEKEIGGLQEEIEENTKQTLTKGKEVGFETIGDIKAVLLSDATLEEVEQQEEDLKKQEIELNTTLQEVSVRLEKEVEQKLTEESQITLQNKITTVQKELREVQEQIGSLNEKLARDAEIRESQKTLTQQITLQEKEYKRWNDLNDVIGSANGDKFRIFAQSLTLEKLTHIANHHLDRLNGRYQIRLGDANELGLDIVDTFQADNVRSMETLSGGESFLVSLALALGLSDMASKHSEISSLFIDEGFGTLDAATLDLAIATLENLQSRGKMIGVISHIEALKERIGTQIQVRRKGGGVSELLIV